MGYHERDFLIVSHTFKKHTFILCRLISNIPLHSVASYALIRDRWSGLKSKVPDWQVKSYRLMMAHLWEHKMPKLVKKDEDKKAVQDFYEEVKHCF